jgi:hypothetical protein
VQRVCSQSLLRGVVSGRGPEWVVEREVGKGQRQGKVKGPPGTIHLGGKEGEERVLILCRGLSSYRRTCQCGEKGEKRMTYRR